jgi:hypothetical protein
MAPSRDEVSAGSILRELIFNQYQAIIAGGAAVASAITLNPLPLLVLLGSELVLLPILDSGPLRRLVARRKRELASAEATRRRARLTASFTPGQLKRYSELEQLCRLIETNYQGLTGISQAYLAEQRAKLDSILESCLHRILAIQRYQKMPVSRNPADIKREIAALEDELEHSELTDRARAALQKNLELKGRLLKSYSEMGDTVKALATELDSMASLLEVLHQNSISLRDPQAISEELDTIVKQSEDSERVVREMEALLRADSPAWNPDFVPDVDVPVAEPGTASQDAVRRKVRRR